MAKTSKRRSVRTSSSARTTAAPPVSSGEDVSGKDVEVTAEGTGGAGVKGTADFKAGKDLQN